MRKPDSLRAALTAAMPDYARDPDRLLIFIDEGGIAAVSGSLNFEYRYTCNVHLLDFAEHPDRVFVAILAWLQEHQPELLQAQPGDRNGIRFEADIQGENKIDLSIFLPLTEAVRVSGGPDAPTCEHLAEPTVDEVFEGVAPEVRLREIWKLDELLVPRP